MITDYPVVIYGASGYTGRLIAEFLREYQISFIAAGRNKSRIEEGLKYVPGIENADYRIVEVEHTVEALTELFKGKKVVCNTVGPFPRFGMTVVEAALNAGCHYLDTTGEQEFLLQVDNRFGEAYAEANLVCSPATAYMFTVSDIAARICLETPGIDSLNIRQFCAGTPTVASTQSIFDIVRQKAHRLVNNELVEYPAIEVADLAIPFSDQVLKATHWGGGSHVAFFRNDTRVRNCNLLQAAENQETWKGLKKLERAYLASLQWLPEDQQIAALNNMAGEIQGALPPRENRQSNLFVDWCHGRGNNVVESCYIVGNNSYQITGLLQAYSAMRLLKDTPAKTGFRSICEVLGHRELLAAMQGYGYVSVKEEVFA